MMIKYTAEQKRNALSMLNELGLQKTQEATNIPPTTLYRWKKLQDNQSSQDAETATENSLKEVPSQEVRPEDIVVSEDRSADLKQSFLNDRLIQSLLDEIENLKITNDQLRRDNDKYRRVLAVLLER